MVKTRANLLRWHPLCFLTFYQGCTPQFSCFMLYITREKMMDIGLESSSGTNIRIWLYYLSWKSIKSFGRLRMPRLQRKKMFTLRKVIFIFIFFFFKFIIFLSSDFYWKIHNFSIIMIFSNANFSKLARLWKETFFKVNISFLYFQPSKHFNNWKLLSRH